MAAYELRWKRSALKELRALTLETVGRIVAAAEALAHEPHPTGSRKLVGARNLYRQRVGDYRIVYSVAANELVVEVIRVGHRKDVYR